jgi:indolepyruvate ferredoxin oxidoreductase beta subunit
LARNPLAANMVLLGAPVQTGNLPVRADTVREAIRKKTKAAFADSNVKAFDLGFSVAQAQAS